MTAIRKTAAIAAALTGARLIAVGLRVDYDGFAVRALVCCLIFAACGDGVVAINFPPSGLTSGTELITFQDQVHAVELGSVWRPTDALPESDLTITALIYSGTPAENGLTAGELVTEYDRHGPLKDRSGLFALTISEKVSGEWRVIDQVPELLQSYQVRHRVTALGSGSGEERACLLIDDRRVYCWDRFEPPRLVAELREIEEIATGLKHTCARTGDGRVLCFGSNLEMQLGRPTLGGADPVPVEVPGVDRVTQISAGGNRTCALRAGEVICWGSFFSLQPIDPAPARVDFPVPIEKIAAGTYAVCGLGGGSIYCSGYSGNLGLIAGLCSAGNYQPTAKIDLPRPAIDLDLGDATACVLLDNYELHCWGCNSVGQLGTGEAGGEAPVQLILSDIKSVDLGWHFGCAVKRDDELWCWGRNDRGQVGQGVPPSETIFAPSRVLREVIEARAHWVHACAITRDLRTYCWGSGEPAPVQLNF